MSYMEAGSDVQRARVQATDFEGRRGAAGALMVREVRCIDCPSYEVFRHEYLDCAVPVVIRGGLGDCPAMRWTPESLAARVGQQTVSVAISGPDGVFNDYARQLTMDFASALDLVRSDSSRKYYVVQQPIPRDFPQIVGDVHYPPMLETLFSCVGACMLNLWLSGSGSVTPLHFDVANNFLVQISGVKTLVLYAPDETRYLYPVPDNAMELQRSQVDARGPRDDRFPLFERAARHEVTLPPGAMLFIPAGWWHLVRSEGVCLSLNMWWQPPARQLSAPNLMRFLRLHYYRNRLRDIYPTLQAADSSISDVTMPFLEAGAPWLAALLAGAKLDRTLRQWLGGAGVALEALPLRFQSYQKQLVALGRGAAVDEDLAEWDRLTVLARTDTISQEVSREMAVQLIGQAQRWLTRLDQWSG